MTGRAMTSRIELADCVGLASCVGLTGGIGCGKSTVSALFAQLGVAIIDSDTISHQLTQPQGDAIEPIRSAFGDDYLDASGALDRARMRQLVFADPAAKLRLEAILHPLIRARMLAQASTYNSSPYLLMVIPLLFESPNYQTLVQGTLVVDCSEATQIARTVQRNGLDETTVRAIMATQIARAERLRRADEIIRNDGDLSALQQQVSQLHQHYLTLFAGSD